jgi:hypothetical protein
MARSFGTNLLELLSAQETDKVVILLLTIEHANLSPSIRVTSDSVNTVSNQGSGDETYYSYPFQITLPNDPEEGFSAGKLTIDNIHRDITASVRAIDTPPTAKIQLVIADDPTPGNADTVYVEFADFELRNISYDALTVTADLVMEHFMHEPFPGDRITPSLYPGLF